MKIKIYKKLYYCNLCQNVYKMYTYIPSMFSIFNIHSKIYKTPKKSISSGYGTCSFHSFPRKNGILTRIGWRDGRGENRRRWRPFSKDSPMKMSRLPGNDGDHIDRVYHVHVWGWSHAAIVHGPQFQIYPQLYKQTKYRLWLLMKLFVIFVQTILSFTDTLSLLAYFLT